MVEPKEPNYEKMKTSELLDFLNEELPEHCDFALETLDERMPFSDIDRQFKKCEKTNDELQAEIDALKRDFYRLVTILSRQGTKVRLNEAF